MNSRQRCLGEKGKKKNGVFEAANQAAFNGIFKPVYQNHQAGILDDAVTLYKKNFSIDPYNTEVHLAVLLRDPLTGTVS